MAPTDNLLRALTVPAAAEFRDDTDGEAGIMTGHFAVFNEPTTIDSYYEGRFIERIAPGAFADTFEARGDQIRVLYDHGADPAIGNKPLGVPTVLREDKRGAYYEVELFDTAYVSELKPALRAGQLGASFRFRVTSEDWTEPTRASKTNPERLPERTITGIELYEFGPVTFPAYDSATAGMRSMTDEWFGRMLDDPEFAERLAARMGPKVFAQMISTLPAVGRNDEPAEEAPVGPTESHTQAERRQWVATRFFAA